MGGFLLPALALVSVTPWLSPGPSSAVARSSTSSSFRVHTEPSALLLEQASARAEVLIELPRDAAASDVEVITNAGTVTPPRQDADDPSRWRATYLAPEAWHPQVAIVVVTAKVDGQPRFAWTRLLLIGKGTVAVRERPGVRVSLEVAGRRYGPVVADAGGIARVPVEVPPGYDVARYGRRQLPIGVVPFSRALLVPEARRVHADEPADTRVLVFAVDERGRPLADAGHVRLTAEAGSLGPLVPLEPGVLAARYRPPTTPEASVTLRAFLRGDEAHASEERLEIVPGVPAKLSLLFSRPRYVAGEPPLTLQVRVLDRRGVATGSGTVVLDVKDGLLGEPDPISPGVVEVKVRPSDTLPAHRTLRVEARVVSNQREPLVAHAELPLLPAAPASIDIVPLAARLDADGETRGTLRVVVRDAYGNPTPDLHPSAHALLGSASVSATEEGYEVHYRAPLTYSDDSDVIEVTAGDARQTLSVGLVPRTRRFSLGATVGGISNFVGLHAPQGALEGAYRLDDVSPLLTGVEVVVELALFHRWAPNTASLAGPVDAQLTGVPLSVGARYHYAPVPWLSLYGGAAATMAGLNSVVSAGATAVERFLAVGGFVAAGAAWHIGAVALVVEGRGNALVSEPQSTLTGFIGGASLLGGVRLALF